MRIRAKLAVGFLAVLAAGVPVLLVSLYTFEVTDAEFQALKGDVVPSAIAMAEMERACCQAQHHVTKYILHGRAEDARLTRSSLAALVEAGAAHLEQDKRRGPQKHPVARRELPEKIRAFRSAVSSLLDRKNRGESSEALSRYDTEEVHPLAAALGRQAREHMATHMVELAEAERAVGEAHRRGILAVLLGSGCVLLVAAVAVVIASKRLVKPLHILERSTREIAQGRLGYRTAMARSDEIGQLSRSFDAMADALSNTLVSKNSLKKSNRALEAEVASRERTEEAARESERRLAQTIDFLPDPTLVVDRFGVIVAWNRAMEDLTGAKANEMIGRGDHAYAVPLYGERRPFLADIALGDAEAEELYDKVTHDGDTVMAEIDLPGFRPGGASLWAKARPLRDGTGEVVGAIEAVRDITPRKRAEEALAQRTRDLERSNAELQEFAYVASHDLQEPLRMVASYVQLLEKRYADALDDDAREFIGYAADGAKRMAMLINDLLAYSRVGTSAKPFTPTDGETLLEDVLANLEVAIKESGARVTHDPLPEVVADEGQLARVFQNLIDNALKFCEGTPEVHVGVEHEDGQWRFTVRDNGIGIAPDQRENVFSVFQRLHRRDEYAGTGMGLAISKKIVERHGGRIWVESQVGEGSTFTFTIPGRKEAGNGHEHGHGDGVHRAVAYAAGRDSAG